MKATVVILASLLGQALSAPAGSESTRQNVDEYCQVKAATSSKKFDKQFCLDAVQRCQVKIRDEAKADACAEKIMADKFLGREPSVPEVEDEDGVSPPPPPPSAEESEEAPVPVADERQQLKDRCDNSGNPEACQKAATRCAARFTKNAKLEDYLACVDKMQVCLSPDGQDGCMERAGECIADGQGQPVKFDDLKACVQQKEGQ
ncbi:hypothetical protein XA68_17271 [Ophiocordyceps unilateralis]|uniref:Uncharacterized protein n=1 Tax=Ophiocordyceps unilateralis TaxID=268505 RepID=A0A2A9PS82_OPHUN|nr:hypothetical protein XA68_17271 [Ophiocordyceps unilateralis]